MTIKHLSLNKLFGRQVFQTANWSCWHPLGVIYERQYNNLKIEMKLKLTPKYIVTFLALTFLMHEAHEIVHTSVGRIVCGAWGTRDFNVWGTCESCAANPFEILSTAAGPIFTFIMIWLGSSLLKQDKTENQKAFGFSLIFANIPFGRIFNPIFGGGDEVVVVDSILHNWELSRLVVLFLIFLIITYPLFKTYKLIENKYKVGWFLGFLILPIICDLLIVLGVMNTILEKGVLNNYWILGSPILVTVWTFSVLTIYLLTRKNIFELTKK